jgi:hypothetical protein
VLKNLGDLKKRQKPNRLEESKNGVRRINHVKKGWS